MTKKYKYIEYEKLSDAVKDWENGEQIYREIDDICTIQHNTVAQFLTSGKYAKRVEIKEKTVETWVIFDCEGVPRCIGSENIGNLPTGWQNRKLTGAIEGVVPKADNRREYLMEDDRGHGGQLGV